MHSGRKKFKSLRCLIVALVFFISMLPAFIRRLMYQLSASMPTIVGVGVRYVFLKSLCPTVGDNVYIGRWVVIKGFDNLCIGSDVSIHEFCYVDASGGIFLGNSVSMAHGSSLISFEHTWEDISVPIKYNPIVYKQINIGNDVWIGCGVRILAGSVVEDRSVIGAGSVVKGTLTSNGVYVGSPAKLIKKF